MDRTACRDLRIRCFSPHLPDGVGIEASRVMNSAFGEDEVFLLRPNRSGVFSQECRKKKGKQGDRNRPANLPVEIIFEKVHHSQSHPWERKSLIRHRDHRYSLSSAWFPTALSPDSRRTRRAAAADRGPSAGFAFGSGSPDHSFSRHVRPEP
ncbi:MAG: hypothetical protein H6Q42_2109 [Deltaproteobacteria bacterium]|nr:hypothetical protein [Deltaproteobacteria bacterium]